jgi:hypothetical protein
MDTAKVIVIIAVGLGAIAVGAWLVVAFLGRLEELRMESGEADDADALVDDDEEAAFQGQPGKRVRSAAR